MFKGFAGDLLLWDTFALCEFAAGNLDVTRKVAHFFFGRQIHGHNKWRGEAAMLQRLHEKDVHGR